MFTHLKFAAASRGLLAAVLAVICIGAPLDEALAHKGGHHGHGPHHLGNRHHSGWRHGPGYDGPVWGGPVDLPPHCHWPAHPVRGIFGWRCGA